MSNALKQPKPTKHAHHHHHDHGDGCGCHGDSKTVKRESAKIGRNDKCPCGSGKKYKKCCAA